MRVCGEGLGRRRGCAVCGVRVWGEGVCGEGVWGEGVWGEGVGAFWKQAPPTTYYCLLLTSYLLEARAAEADARLEELGADARVHTNGVGHLAHVGAGDLVRVRVWVRVGVAPVTMGRVRVKVKARGKLGVRLGFGLELGLGSGLGFGFGGAPVTSQSAEIELMLEMRCARNALAVSFESSALHRLVVSTWASGTHLVRVRRRVRRRVRHRVRVRAGVRQG